MYNNVHWLTVFTDIAILNLLVFMTSRLFKNNIHTKRATIMIFPCLSVQLLFYTSSDSKHTTTIKIQTSSITELILMSFGSTIF